MDYLSFFLSVTVSHLSFYFYHSDSKKINFPLNISDIFSNNSPKLLNTSTNKKNDELLNNIDSRLSDNKLTLKRNLKHLEFINYLENHLCNEAHENMSVDFLNEFNTIKQDVQLKTIEASKRLS